MRDSDVGCALYNGKDNRWQIHWWIRNKTNLRDLIATASLVILLKLDSNRFFGPCDLQIWWMTSENNRTPLLHCKLCASFQTNWIQTAVTVQKHSNWVKIGNFLSCLNLKFDGWPWQTIGHLFYATLSFVNHFKAIGEFKLEWQSGTLNSAQNQWYLFLVTLKYHGWPWKTIGHLCYATSRFEHHFIAICEFELELQSQKSKFWVKIDNFFSPVTLKFDG